MAFFSLPRSLLDSNDFGLMVCFVGWETIEIWFSGVREYRTGENDKLNYLCPEMKWPIMRAAGTGGAYRKFHVEIKGVFKRVNFPQTCKNCNVDVSHAEFENQQNLHKHSCFCEVIGNHHKSNLTILFFN